VRFPQLIAVLGGLGMESSAFAQAPLASQVTDHNRIGLTVTNYAAFGNNFVSRSPSFEFPVGTGYEHLTHAGLWIGARARRNGSDRVGVSTAAIDAALGVATATGTEFTPFTGFARRSSLTQSVFYDPAAVSEFDLLCSYRDDPGQSVTGSDPHVPLGVSVAQDIYAWADDAIFVRLRLSAMQDPLSDLYVGLYSEFASGPKNAYSSWPPTSSGGGALGGWFSKKLLSWDPGRRLLAEHYCQYYLACSYQITPPWAGVVLLGTSLDSPVSRQVGLQIWNYAPGEPDRDEDVERYALLNSPHQTPADSLLPGFAIGGLLSDPVELLTTGPFALSPSAAGAPAESIEVAFAFVAGESFEDLLAATDHAQAIYDAHYRLPSTAARLSLVDAEAGERSVRLRWHSALDAGRSARIERSMPEGEWVLIGEADVDASGLLVHEDRNVQPGVRYGYRAGISGDSGMDWTEPAWVDVPATGRALAFLGGRFRVLAGAIDVEFSLPGPGPARLEAFDVIGRRVASKDVDGIGPGNGAIRLAAAGELPPGVYFLRLSQGSVRAISRTLLLP
jgi:hypothetical protein